MKHGRGGNESCVYVRMCAKGSRQASPGKPYRRFLGERFEASVGFDSTTRKRKVQEYKRERDR